MIDVPPGDVARPTGARVREALFSILTHMDPGVPESHLLDACAGSGALGFEALSRGATHATFFDTERAAREAIADTAGSLGFGSQVSIKRADVRHPPVNRGGPCDLVFLDPPYDSDIAALAPAMLVEAGWIGPDSLLVIETRQAAPVIPENGFEVIDNRTYGDTALFFLNLSR
jgi:16S rRNA (guanine966-N2)-methyltransferase